MAYIYAGAIILYLKHLEAPIERLDLNIGGTSIDRVLDQFFQSIDWRGDDFSGSNEVDNGGVKSLVQQVREM